MQDGEVKNKLSPAQVSVMRHRVTEPPYFGKYWDLYEKGVYRCAACDTPLFASTEKFDSKTGWPTFKKPLSERDLQFKSEPGPEDKVEVRCKKCKSHLGYVIPSDPPYYRINSVCLQFEAEKVPVPAAPAVAPAADPDVTKKADKKAIAVIPAIDDSSVVIAQPAEAARISTSFVTGLIIGLVVGAGLTWLLVPRNHAAVSQIATSTAQIASTTPVNTPTTTVRQKTPSSSTKSTAATPATPSTNQLATSSAATTTQ